MKIINLLTGEQNAGIPSHSSTHHTGGTDPISAEAIGAEVAGAANSAIAAHTAQANPHSQYLEEVSWGIISRKPETINFSSNPTPSGNTIFWSDESSNSQLIWSYPNSGNSSFQILDNNLDLILSASRSSGGSYALDGYAQKAEAAIAASFGVNWANYDTLRTLTYRRFDKRVSLSGLVKRTGNVGNTITTLPPGYRLSKSEVFTCYGYFSSAYNVFRVDVNTDGNVNIAYPLPAANIDFLSLSGISFFTA